VNKLHVWQSLLASFRVGPRDIRHNEARSQSPVIEEKSRKSSIGQKNRSKNTEKLTRDGLRGEQLHQLVHNHGRGSLHRPPHQPVQEQLLARHGRTSLSPVPTLQSQSQPPATLTLPVLGGAGNLVQSIGSSNTWPEFQLNRRQQVSGIKLEQRVLHKFFSRLTGTATALPTVDLSVHLKGKCQPSTRSTSLNRVWQVPSLTATNPQSSK
jgi:hypothetical protein